MHCLAARPVLIIQTSFWCRYCTKEKLWRGPGAGAHPPALRVSGLNKWRGSAGRRDSEETFLPFLPLNGNIKESHARILRAILFWLSGYARIVFPEARREKIESALANKKWNTTVCLSSVAIILKFHRALMESIKTECVWVYVRLSFRTCGASVHQMKASDAPADAAVRACVCLNPCVDTAS